MDQEEKRMGYDIEKEKREAIEADELRAEEKK